MVKTIFYTAGVDDTMLGLRRDGTVETVKVPPRQFDPRGSTPGGGNHGMRSMRNFIKLSMLIWDVRTMMVRCEEKNYVITQYVVNSLKSVEPRGLTDNGEYEHRIPHVPDPVATADERKSVAWMTMATDADVSERCRHCEECMRFCDD